MAEVTATSFIVLGVALFMLLNLQQSPFMRKGELPV